MSKHKKHSGTHKASRSSRSRKKALLLLIILGVAVMIVYALSFQDAEDEQFIQETQTQSENP